MLFSETRGYMALVMGGAMAIVMLAFMWHMYRRRAANLAILAAAAALIVAIIATVIDAVGATLAATAGVAVGRWWHGG